MFGYINYQLLEAGSDLGGSRDLDSVSAFFLGRSVGNERSTSSAQAFKQSEE